MVTLQREIVTLTCFCWCLFFGWLHCLIQRGDGRVQPRLILLVGLIIVVNLVTLSVIRAVLSEDLLGLVIEVLDPDELS